MSIDDDFSSSEYRIFGPPGCGKTTRVAAEITRAARAYGSENVVACSFTKAAAQEIAGRAVPLPKQNVGTLHSFCFRALGHPTIAEGKAKEWNALHPTSYYRFAGAANSMDDASGTGACAALAEWNTWRARLTEGEPGGLLLSFSRAWEGWKKEMGYQDFTDLIANCLRDVEQCPGNPRVGFYDEAQDFTPLELALVRKWGARMKFFILVGDDDQCIYSFKGASPEAFLRPELPQDHKIILSQSYRVPRAVHAAALPLAESLSVREPKEYRPRDADGAFSRDVRSMRNSDAYLVADTIAKLAKEGKSVMVLASCGYMLGGAMAVTQGGEKTVGILDAVKERGIPVGHAYRPERGDWNPLRGAGRRLAAYMRPDPRTWGEYAGTWRLSEIWSWLEFCAVGEQMAHGAKARIKQEIERGGLDREVPIKEVDSWFLPGVQWWSGRPETLRRLWLGNHRESLSYPLKCMAHAGRESIVRDPLVTIGTIHSVKGAEADVVIVAPDLSGAGAASCTSAASLARDSTSRLFYVALTRAREQVILMAPSSDLSAPIGRAMD